MTMMKNKGEPLISILIVNYNSESFLEACLLSVQQQDYKNFEVVLVDNASTDNSVRFVAERFPWVKIVKSPQNLGFAGGNNLGFLYASGDYIVLLNNDTKVERGWLSNLVNAAYFNERAGVVGSKILFYVKFLPVILMTETFIPWNSGISNDTRVLGVKILDNIRFYGTSYKKIFYESGYYGVERNAINHCDFRWTSGVSRVFVPYDERQREYILTFIAAGDSQKAVKVFIGDTLIDTIIVNEEYREVKLKVSNEVVMRHGVYLINNAGSYRRFAGIAGDIGFGEVDHGQFDQQREVNNLCGCSLLIKRRMLDEIGTFDERLFMYYEDTDLCWRAEKKGWKFIYCPNSVVKHVHAGSSQEWSPFFTFHAFRNSYLIVIKNGTWREIIYATYHLIRPLSKAMVDTILSLLKGSLNKAALTTIRHHLIILLSAFRNTIPFLYTRFKGSR